MAWFCYFRHRVDQQCCGLWK